MSVWREEVSTRKDPNTKPQFASAAQVAAMLNVSTTHVYRLISNEELPAFRVGRLIRIPHKGVTAYLDRARIDAENYKR